MLRDIVDVKTYEVVLLLVEGRGRVGVGGGVEFRVRIAIGYRVHRVGQG